MRRRSICSCILPVRPIFEHFAAVGWTFWWNHIRLPGNHNSMSKRSSDTIVTLQCVWKLQTRSYDCWRIWTRMTAMEMVPRTVAKTKVLAPFTLCKKWQPNSAQGKTKRCQLYSTGDVMPRYIRI